MGINSRVVKIPFFVLYLLLTLLTSFNLIRVILSQKILKFINPFTYNFINYAINFRIT